MHCDVIVFNTGLNEHYKWPLHNVYKHLCTQSHTNFGQTLEKRKPSYCFYMKQNSEWILWVLLQFLFYHEIPKYYEYKGWNNVHFCSKAILYVYFFFHLPILHLQVIGIPDERMGEELCAWIRLKAGQEATPEEIKAFCKGKVSIAGFTVNNYLFIPLVNLMFFAFSYVKDGWIRAFVEYF